MTEGSSHHLKLRLAGWTLLLSIGLGALGCGGSSTGAKPKPTPTPAPQQVVASNSILALSGGSVVMINPGTGMVSKVAPVPNGVSNGAIVELLDGRVLYAGGNHKNGAAVNKAWIWDSYTGRWSAAGHLNVARTMASAVTCNDGTVLISGGTSSATKASAALSSAEIFSPTTGRFTSTGSMASARVGHVATLLPNNSVLVTGGANGLPLASATILSSAEVFNPISGQWTAVTNQMQVPRYGHTATLMDTGDVVVAGTEASSCGSASCAATDIYDPASNSFSAGGDMVNARYDHTATRLPGGGVLVTGGLGANQTVLASSEFLDPKTLVWSSASPMQNARANHAAVLLSDGRVFLIGGTTATANIEYYAQNASDLQQSYTSIALPAALAATSAVVLTPRAVNQVSMATGGSVYDYTNSMNTTLRICQPNTTICRTVTGMIIDSGSTGFRVFASKIGGLALPSVTTSGGALVGDCEQYVTSAVWGGVYNADIWLGQQKVTMPIQVIDDTASFADKPATCTGTATNNPSSFGGNGLIGISNPLNDGGIYYGCTNGSCDEITPTPDEQVPSATLLLPVDNNGTVVNLPAIDTQQPLVPDVAMASYGTLTWGVGTETNNQPGAGVTAYASDDGGYVTTTYNGIATTNSYFDTGTTELAFLTVGQTGIPKCKVNTGFYCPAQNLNLSATVQGHNGVGNGTVDFSVGNLDAEWVISPTEPYGGAIDNYAQPDSGTFAWGGPFFFGRQVYITLNKSTSPFGTGPFYAF